MTVISHASNIRCEFCKTIFTIDPLDKAQAVAFGKYFCESCRAQGYETSEDDTQTPKASTLEHAPESGAAGIPGTDIDPEVETERNAAHLPEGDEHRMIEHLTPEEAANAEVGLAEPVTGEPLDTKEHEPVIEHDAHDDGA